MTLQCMKDFHPLVTQWFTETFSQPTPAQAQGWPPIAAGKNVLLLAPTGSGKTLAAFLKVIDRLYQEMEEEDSPLNTGVKILYISPLKALNNDIHRNLELPLQGIKEFCARQGKDLPEISRAVRSGDTPAAERQRMLRRPPQILITTPESLFLMLSSKAHQILKTVRCVIVDEIHTLFTEKRGAHLALSLERLQTLVEESAGPGKNRLQRIGLSATMQPLTEVAAFLGGYEHQPDSGEIRPRPVEIIDTGQRRELDLQITLPVPNLRELPEKTIWPSIYNKVTELVREHRTTLVFVNNRRLAERVTANINKVAGKEIARTHHGSLSREIRQDVERKLKSGELPCIVATASLELGIDVGEIDLVIQIESPKEVARGLQRVGRAGHLIDRSSKGRIIPKNRADLLEAAALIYEMRAGRVEQMKAPMNCLDILAQQLVAVTVTGEERVERVYQMARSAYNYHTLSHKDFERVLAMLNGNYETKEYLDLRPRLYWEKAEGIIKPDSYGKRLVYTAGGTIPDRGYFGVYLTGSNLRLGELDEEFVYERRLNERFVLGTSVWRIEEIRQDRVIVSPAGKGEAHVPFWKAEQGGRSYELGKRIGAFLAMLEEHLDSQDFPAFFQTECNLHPDAIKNLQRYLAGQKRAVDYLPTDRRIVIEEFPDEAGEWRILIHSTLGNRIHLPLALLIGAAWERKLGKRFSALTGDDGIMFSVPGGINPPAVDWPALSPEGVEEELIKAVSGTPLFGAVFRHCAQRSLVMPRGGFGGKRLPLWLARLRAVNLLQIVGKYQDFPLVYETYREIFQDYLELDALRQVLQEIRTGEIVVYRRRRQTPSPFAHGHLFNFEAIFMYDTDLDRPKGEDHKRLFGLGQESLKAIVGQGGFRELFQTEVIREVQRKAQGIALLDKGIDPERIQYWLERCGDITEEEIDGALQHVGVEVGKVFSALQAKGQAVLVEFPSLAGEIRRRLIVSRDDLGTYLRALEGARVYGTENVRHGEADGDGIGSSELGAISNTKDKERIIQRYIRTHGPFTVGELATRYGFIPQEVAEVLAVLAAAGLVESGEFIPGGMEEEWCDTEILREIHRRSLSKVRQEVKSRTRLREPQDYTSFLLRWQGVAGERREAEGMAETLSQMAGLWYPAAMWERSLLPARVKGYNPLLLDRLFGSGQFLWRARGGAENFQIMMECAFPPENDLSVFPKISALLPVGDSARFGVGEASDSTAKNPLDDQEQAYTDDNAVTRLSGICRLILNLLQERGAETLPFILKAVKQPTATVWQALEELMLTGLITNDSFGPIRYLLRTRPQSRAGAKGVLQPALMAQMGRWSLLPPLAEEKTTLVRGLLNRYGIVCREIAQAEGISWGAVYPIFDTLENIGQVQRGYFIKGLSGIQYALPQALTEFNTPSHQHRRYWALHWSDPANPLRFITGWPETAEKIRISGDFLVFAEGRPLLVASGRKLRLNTLESLSPAALQKSLEALMTILYPAYPDEKIIVSSFNGEAASKSQAKEALCQLGFEEGYQVMTLWPSDR